MNKLRGECSVNINGKECPMIFNLYSFSLFCNRMGIELPEMPNVLAGEGNIYGISNLVWCAIKAKSDELNKSINVNPIEVSEFLISGNDKEQSKINEALEYAMKSLSNESDSDDKKK